MSRGAVPPASETLMATVALLFDRQFWASFVVTVQQFLAAVGLGSAVAILAGLAIGRHSRLRAYLAGSIDFFRAVPTVALLPLFVLILGSGLNMVALLAAYAAIWQVIIPTIAGARGIKPVTLDTAKAFRLGRVRTFFQIVLPSTLPFIGTGVRLGATRALLVVIAAQLLAGSPGLGRDMALARQGGQVVSLYSLVLMTGFIGLALNGGLRHLERTRLHWHGSAQEI